MNKLIIAPLLLTLASCSSSAGDKKTETSDQQTKPNIIFILADDMGYGDLAVYGQEKILTPNIDAMAADGKMFTQYYSGSTVCGPARSTLMTGLSTGHTAVRGNKTFKPEGQYPLPDSIVTIANQLQKAGYKTAAFGKWSLGYITTTGAPDKKGIDEFFGYNCQTLAHSYYPDHLWHNDERLDYPDNPHTHEVYSADLIHKKALEFIRSQSADTPFFAYLPYTLPHAELTPPHDSIYDYYVKHFDEAPKKIRKASDTAHGKPFEPYPHAAYAAMVARLDKYVGEIRKLVREQGLAENTIIIFTSDNGPHREDGGDPEYFNSGGGLRGIKRDLYEGGIREPFIVDWKGTVKAGTVDSTNPIVLYDVYATLLDIISMSAPATDGISFLPALKGENQPHHSYLYWELHESGGKQAVRMDDWKLVKLDVMTDKPAASELYDLKTDPAEKNNVAAAHPDIVAKMEQYMKEAHVANTDWPLYPSED